MMEIIRPNSLFFEIFDSIQFDFTSRRDAYVEAERLFGEKCEIAFGRKFKKFDAYESFLSAYNRETNKVLNQPYEKPVYFAPADNDLMRDYL